MIWSRESLRELSEQDLCLKVLIPLFREMGYRDVRYYHGGPLEQGKDIVMWRHDELKGRVNYAVVVKAEKITGSASAVSVVAFQAQQALGSSFLDEVTHEEHSVHEVLIVTSREITKEGHESLANALKGARVSNIVKIDGDTLWGLIEKYLPHERVFSSLTEASKALNEMDPEYGYTVEVSPGTVRTIAFPKHGRNEPMPVSFTPKFPDTPEGKEQQQAFQRFLTAGQPAEVKAEYLEIAGLPAPFNKMLGEFSDGTFHFGPRVSSAVLSVSMHLEATDTEEEIHLMPLIEFGRNIGGEEEVALSNDQQPTPFKFYLTLRWSDRTTNFRFNFEEAQDKALSMLRAAEFEAALSKGGTLILRDYASGQKIAGFFVPAGLVSHPGEVFIDLLRKLVWIQRRLNLDFDLPRRDLFEDGDVEEILAVESILRTGKLLRDCFEVSIAFKPGGMDKLLIDRPDGVLGEMQFVQGYKQKLLGVDVDLGPIDLSSKRVYIDSVEIRRSDNSSEESPVVRLRSRDGAFRVVFRNWPRGSEVQQCIPQGD